MHNMTQVNLGNTIITTRQGNSLVLLKKEKLKDDVRYNYLQKSDYIKNSNKSCKSTIAAMKTNAINEVC